MCDGYTHDGYLAIAPALFDRYQKNVELGYSPDDIAKERELKVKAQTGAALKDIAAARDAATHVGNVGVIGYKVGRVPGFGD